MEKDLPKSLLLKLEQAQAERMQRIHDAGIHFDEVSFTTIQFRGHYITVLAKPEELDLELCRALDEAEWFERNPETVILEALAGLTFAHGYSPTDGTWLKDRRCPKS